MELPAVLGVDELVAAVVGEVVVGGADEDHLVDVGVAVGGWCVGGEVVGFAVGG